MYPVSPKFSKEKSIAVAETKGEFVEPANHNFFIDTPNEKQEEKETAESE